MVSIPYRDDKNRLEVYKKAFGILLFQSLIGTIKTSNNNIFFREKFAVSIPYRDDKNRKT